MVPARTERTKQTEETRLASVSQQRREYVAELARKNREFYGTTDGRGILRSLELIFAYRWVYIFELIQNALDASAQSIAIQVSDDGDTLILQHDGTREFDEPDVEALSKVFRSTKSASSVGFMGIGFKSVFMRFQEARISGWGWTFRYEVERVKGAEYGDVQTDLLGAVVPIWDPGVPRPDPGFTTRFELSTRMDQNADLESDLARLLPDTDRTPLAILAVAGLELFDVNGAVWELGVAEEKGGSLEATALSEAENLIWQLFSTQFQPSRDAIAVFLEHRRIQPTDEERDRAYAEAAKPRRILGVLPLDNEGVPAPPNRGSVYATLPTEVTVPFGLHINADWLLDISRGGLRELEDNPWQRGIANGIVDILAQFVEWCSGRLTEVHAAKAAFQALALPSPDAGGLETLLAQEDWLSRLRHRLAEAPVIPVWTTDTRAVTFVRSKEAIVPPDPLARAFAENPELQPSVLLNGSVLRSDIVGPDATELLRRLDLLTSMRPQHLALAWQGGLDDWWTVLPDDDAVRSHLLFRVWAAVAKLTSKDAWKHVRLPCVRSITGRWLPVNETTFHKEGLPAEGAPGGLETRRFLQSVVRDTNRLDPRWVSALRQRRPNEPRSMLLSQVWDWVEDHARGISLREIVNDAVKTLASSANPDWSPLLSLGHWAKHGSRPKLLVYVLVESTGNLRGVPVGDALLADPYIEHGQDRRQLFGGVPAIAREYLEEDPTTGAPHEWRVFFEKAGARGKLAVQEVGQRCDRRERQNVASFLGRSLPVETTSNNDGYRLVDFDIAPSLPDPNAPEVLRRSLAKWLADGFAVLKQTGRRTTTYSYYGHQELVGRTPSAWVTKLSELAWVPCDDEELRCPRDTLPNSDPAREEAPVAQLPPALLTVLDQEGLQFGAAIPEATSLRRLLATGTRLEAEELAELLSDCRQQPMTDADWHLFDQVLQDLTVPLSDGRRVPVTRIVRRVGGRRGELGGWIAPLDSITEPLRAELQHPDFPIDFPETTTGEQALDFIVGTWQRARSAPKGLASEVRDILPMAYAYCLEDCATDDSLLTRWKEAKPAAMVFAEREWISLAGSDRTYLDDIADRRFIPNDVPGRIVTAGHLGRSREEQTRTADSMDLPLLSSTVTPDWRIRGETPARNDWKARFAIVYGLLQRARRRERSDSDRQSSDPGAPNLQSARELAVEVRVGDSPPQRIPVTARLHEGILTVSGRPVEFGADAANELLRESSLRQRAALAADLTGVLAVIGDQEDFRLSVDKFGRSHVPGYESTTASQESETDEVPTVSRDATDTAQAERPRKADTDTAKDQTGRSDPSAAAAEVSDTSNGKPAGPDSRGGSYNESRAVARQNALADRLKQSLKGKLEPPNADDDTVEPKRTGGSSGGALGDEEYREAAARYEREANREPEFGDPHQVGWDIRSIDPENNEVRFIEVKGKGRLWDGDEVVELSRAQVRESFKAEDRETAGCWYLYVVEKTPENTFRVLPIRNPAQTAARWMLSGRAWRMVAELALERSAGSSHQDP